ncbi:uncharacterized protein [Antedon mediterranea]|uniref:uncharacterized protein n=1 Tax=Antedon mediterranea TaxID=105859 RepID=UPI003AF7B1F6
MTEEEQTTIVIYEDSFPAIRNETVETTVATAILQGFGEAAKAIQLNENVEFVEVDEQESTKDGKKKIKCKHKCLFFEECSKSFDTQQDCVNHMSLEHAVDKDHILLQEFNSFQEFQIWKDHLELDNYVYYTRRNKQDRRFVYYCYRDGQPKPGLEGDLDSKTKTTLRKAKLTKKFGINCPSKMIAKMSDSGRVDVIFYKFHSHSVSLEDTLHQTVPNVLKQELYGQFALNSSVEDVHAMLHGEATSIYPIYKVVVRDLNRRRLRKIAKDFHADNDKHLSTWKKIRPSAQLARKDGPVAAEEIKKSKLISVQHKLEQLYHLLDESVTQNMLLNHMDKSLDNLLKECSVAFAVSNFRFPLENECILKYKPENEENDCDESGENMSLISEQSDEQPRELVNHEENEQPRELVSQEENVMNQGVKRKIEENDDLKEVCKRTWKSHGDIENNRPKFDPVTGNLIGIKIKQNRKKLFKVPQRPQFPGLPLRCLDTVASTTRCVTSATDNSESSSSNNPSEKLSLESSKQGEASELNTTSLTTQENNTLIETQSDGDTAIKPVPVSVTASAVLEKLQLAECNTHVVEDVQIEVGSNIETSVSSQLLEIVNLAKAMVDGDC